MPEIPFRWTVAAFAVAMIVLCGACADVTCLAEREKCRWDCPQTVGLKQICRQKCNLLYDLCREKARR